MFNINPFHCFVTKQKQNNIIQGTCLDLWGRQILANYLRIKLWDVGSQYEFESPYMVAHR